MTRSTAAQSDSALQNLRTLLEVNAQMSRESQEDRLLSTPNDEVREVLEDILDAAGEQRDSLASIIREWEATARRARPRIRPDVEARLEPREFIESWLALKESSAEMYRKAAQSAPTARIRRRLEELADQEAALADRLRDLL